MPAASPASRTRSVWVGAVERAGDGDGEGAVVFGVALAGGEATLLHPLHEGEVMLFGAAADVLDEVVRTGAEAEIDVVLLGKYVTVAVA